MKPYQDKALMYQLYVVKRMNIKDMAELFKANYNCVCTPQTIYNWLKEFDLLKFRGKGRNMSHNKGFTGNKPSAQGRGGVYATTNSDKLKKRRPKGFMGKK